MIRTNIVVLLAGAAALAGCQNNQAANSDDNTLAVNTLVVNDVAGTDLNGAATAGTIDTAFLTDAIKADNGEIQLGQLAQTKGGSKGVKDFGQTLVTDHGKAKDEAATLAQQASMTIPSEPKDEQKTELQKLQGLSGSAFDKEFIRFAIEAHKKDISKFQQEANGTGSTANLAKQQLPTLKKHLQIAQSLQG